MLLKTIYENTLVVVKWTGDIKASTPVADLKKRINALENVYAPEWPCWWRYEARLPGTRYLVQMTANVYHAYCITVCTHSFNCNAVVRDRVSATWSSIAIGFVPSPCWLWSSFAIGFVPPPCWLILVCSRFFLGQGLSVRNEATCLSRKKPKRPISKWVNPGWSHVSEKE